MYNFICELFYTVELSIKKHIDNCTYEEIQPPLKMFVPIDWLLTEWSFNGHITKNYKNPLYQKIMLAKIRKKTKDKDLISEKAFSVH